MRGTREGAQQWGVLESTTIPDVDYGGILVCSGSRRLVLRKRTFLSADKSGILPRFHVCCVSFPASSVLAST